MPRRPKQVPLYDQITAAREAAGYSQNALAAKMGVSQSMLSRLEKPEWHDDHDVKVHTLEKIAEATGARLEIRLIPKGAEA